MSKWLNTEKILDSVGDWKEFYETLEKPCHSCGYCPYGQLVEAFPIHREASAYAEKHDVYTKLNPFGVGWIPCAKEDEGSQPDIEYGLKHTTNKRECQVFGHDCPVYYHAEPLTEEV